MLTLLALPSQPARGEEMAPSQPAGYLPIRTITLLCSHSDATTPLHRPNFLPRHESLGSTKGGQFLLATTFNRFPGTFLKPPRIHPHRTFRSILQFRRPASRYTITGSSKLRLRRDARAREQCDLRSIIALPRLPRDYRPRRVPDSSPTE